MKQTAVYWLIKEYSKYIDDSNVPFEVLKKANEMEKEQMIDFARNIIIDATCSVEGYVMTKKEIEEYYNETVYLNEK